MYRPIAESSVNVWRQFAFIVEAAQDSNFPRKRVGLRNVIPKCIECAGVLAGRNGKLKAK